MPNDEPHPIGRLRRHARAPFDAITREELPQDMRQLVKRLREAEPVKSPLIDKQPPGREDQ